MKWSEVKGLRCPNFEVFETEEWDARTFLNLAHQVPELLDLLLRGTVKLKTFWGVGMGLFTLFFYGKDRWKKTPIPPVNRTVMQILLRVQEIKDLQTKTAGNSAETALTLIKLCKIILAVLPDKAVEMQNQVAPSGGAEMEDDEDLEEEDEGPDGGDGEGPQEDGEDSGEGDEDGDADGDSEGDDSEDGGSDDSNEGASDEDSGGTAADGDSDSGGEDLEDQPGEAEERAVQPGDVPEPERDELDYSFDIDPNEPGEPSGNSGGSGRGDRGSESVAGEGRGDREEDDAEDEGDGGDDSESDGADQEADEGLQLPDTPTPSPEELELTERLENALQRAGFELKEAIENAAAETNDQLDELKTLGKALGYDTSKGLLGQEDPSKAIALANELQKQKKFLEMVHEFGNSIVTIAESAQEQKTTGYGYSVIGRKMGSDPGQMPSDEMWMLTPSKNKRLERLRKALLAKNMIDETLPQKEFQLVLERVCGDNIVLADISYSTQSPDPRVAQHIKAQVLGILSVAMRQKRRLTVIPFNSSPLEPSELTAGGLEAMMQFASLKADGGTDFYKAIQRGLEVLQASGKTSPPDITIITDGLCDIPCFATPEVRAKAIKELQQTFIQMRAKVRAVYVRVPERVPRKGVKRQPDDLEILVGRGNTYDVVDLYDNRCLARLFASI